MCKVPLVKETQARCLFELQLGRLLIYIGHPFILDSAMVYGRETTADYVAAYDSTKLCHIIDLHYFYKGKKIVVEQDESEHCMKKSSRH